MEVLVIAMKIPAMGGLVRKRMAKILLVQMKKILVEKTQPKKTQQSTAHNLPYL
jgi:hypothetical protein